MNALFWAALLAGLSYWPGSRLPLAPELIIAWKGSGLALLTLWAMMRARSVDGWLLALLLAFGTAGDVLIDAVDLRAGGAAFLMGHIVAIGLYRRNLRADARWTALLLIPLIVMLAAALPGRAGAAAPIAFYATGLATMAAFAILSRFRLAAVGAMLFVASDLLIFARLGPLDGSSLPDLLVWPLYFSGQAMIAWDIGARARA